MNSYTSRLNTLATHAVSCLAALACVVIAVSYVTPRPVPEVEISLQGVKALRVSRYDKSDHALLKINLRTDLTKVFDWNVKGIYVSVFAEYATDAHPRNQVVIWDSVISKRARAKVRKSSELAKYALKDYGQNLRSREIVLRVRYVVMPYVGAMEVYTVGNHSSTLPEEYSS
mmetsp:Transcript_5182/g.15501  ORF Transcript_5182/g.15501 Transcript_5182/m.15501 type:complete len:172 (+) Transcript_5182:280-795(+)